MSASTADRYADEKRELERLVRDGAVDSVELCMLALRTGDFGRALRALEAHAAALGVRIEGELFE